MTALSLPPEVDTTDGFDPTPIESLAGLMPQNELRNLLQDLVGDVRLRLERLGRIRVAAGALHHIERDAHDLKSMGGNFGMVTLSRQAGRVERAARERCSRSVGAALPLLLEAGNRSLETVIRHYRLDSGGRR